MVSKNSSGMRELAMAVISSVEETTGRRRKPHAAGVLSELVTPGILGEDAPHGLGRGGEEVAATVPSGVLRPH
jgi:hypothetical protein